MKMIVMAALILAGFPQQIMAKKTVDGAKQLEQRLRLLQPKGYMMAHQDDPFYGVTWEWEQNRSDVLETVGDYPALMGFDLGGIEMDDKKNLDSVPFTRIHDELIAHYERGGIVTISWHPRNPLTGGTAWDVTDSTVVKNILPGGKCHAKFQTWMQRVGDFLVTLKTKKGQPVPIIFRPWHEHTGSWFWWGQEHCTAAQYKALWKMTINRLKDKGVVNALYAYSPGTEMDGNEAKYLERYPGDDIIDVMGLDCYCSSPEADTVKIAGYAAQLDKNLATVCAVAKKHHKAAALTETGYEGIKTADWWTKTLQPVLDKHPICYVLVWRNAYDNPQHYFAPFPGQISTTDFVTFVNNKHVLMRSDVNNIYFVKKKE